MSDIDLEQLLAPMEGEQPCGPDLFDDPRFYQIQQALQGTPERVVGDSVVAAVPPDYAGASRQSRELLKETKDIRLAVMLTDAQLALHGHEGLHDGLRLIHGMLETYWDHVHPVLEDGDALNRVVAIEGFDEFKFKHRIRQAPLVAADGFSSYSQRDLSIALGHEAPTDAEASEGLATLGPVLLLLPSKRWCFHGQ